MYIFLIDTVSKKNCIQLAMYEDSTVVLRIDRVFAPSQQSETFWPLIQEFFLDKKLKKVKPSGIVVVTGPASFTSARQGVMVANALAFAWRIPVAGLTLLEFERVHSRGSWAQVMAKTHPGEFAEPLYDRAPNISLRSGMWAV